MNKCSICGMSDDDNPAHSSNYTDVGKHSFKATVKSADAISLVDDTPITFGNELKSLGDGKLGGWAILFTGPSDPDITNDFFTKETDFFMDGDTKAIRPVLYDHGLDPTLKSRKLGRGKLEIKDAGVWFETELALADDYDRYIEQMAKKGKLGISTGSASHLIQRETIGKSAFIKSWPIVEVSLTPKPIEPRTKSVMSLKSYADERDDGPIFESLKGGPGSGRYPKGSDGESDKEFSIGDLASKSPSKEAADLAKNSSNVALAKVAIHKIGDEDIQLAARQELAARGVSIEQADKLAGQKDSSKRKSFSDTSSVDVTRSMKSIFEEELAGQVSSVYDMDSARDKVLNDIVKAAKLSDISGVNINIRSKITDLAAEHAARWITHATQQAKSFIDGDLNDQGNFSLRSFQTGSLQSFLDESIKSSLASGVTLDEHSAAVVSAISEYAQMGEAINVGMKAYTDRVRRKIEFRTNDSTKAGRTISAANLKKLKDIYDKHNKATSNNTELRGVLEELMALAQPEQKGISDEEAMQLQAMLSFQTQELGMAGVPLTNSNS